jgi:hypothetical protein
MQEVLVDRREFEGERLVQVLDDFLVTFHDVPPQIGY